MSKARGLADLGNAFDDGALSNRNLIINGAMQVAQRGTSATGVTGTGYYTCDRWQYRNGSGGTGQEATHEQSTDAPDGFQNSYKISCTVADATPLGSENEALGYKTEGYDVSQLGYGTSSAKTITLSFWVKSTVTGDYGVQFFNGSSYSALKSYSINAASTWEYKTIQLDGDTVNAFPSGNAQALSLLFHLACGPDDITSEYEWTNQTGFRSITGQANVFATTSDTWQITGVQLEVGDTATPFEHRSYSDEIQRCHRYYYKIGGVSGKRPVICNAMAYSTGELYGVFRLPVPMRTLPSGSYDGLPRGYKPGTAQRLTAFVINSIESSVQELRLRGDNAGYFNAGDASWIQIDSNGEYLDFDAEL